MAQTTRQFGAEQEQETCDYLTKQGLQLLTQNYNCKMGEIDLIMQDKDVYVFVEVRFRSRKDYGGGTASVDKHKQKKLIRTATYYLQQNNLLDKVPCRFDVVSVSDDKNSRFQWIKDAFWVQY